MQCQEEANLGTCDTGAESTANGSFGKEPKFRGDAVIERNAAPLQSK